MRVCGWCPMELVRRPGEKSCNFNRRMFCNKECLRSFMASRSDSNFWIKVDKSGGEAACWTWTGATNNGYGHFRVGNRTRLAHRLSLARSGVIVPDNLDVCHHCDNPSCVNPSHLFVGTAKQNMMDASAKGRTTRGERSYRAKITESDAIRILSEPQSPIVIRELSRAYGLSEAAIRGIRSGRRWAYLSEARAKEAT